MEYIKLNLQNGEKFDANHVKHLEDGISKNSDQIYTLSSRADTARADLDDLIYNMSAHDMRFDDLENEARSHRFSIAELEKQLEIGYNELIPFDANEFLYMFFDKNYEEHISLESQDGQFLINLLQYGKPLNILINDSDEYIDWAYFQFKPYLIEGVPRYSDNEMSDLLGHDFEYTFLYSNDDVDLYVHFEKIYDNDEYLIMTTDLEWKPTRGNTWLSLDSGDYNKLFINKEPKEIGKDNPDAIDNLKIATINQSQLYVDIEIPIDEERGYSWEEFKFIYGGTTFIENTMHQFVSVRIQEDGKLAFYILFYDMDEQILYGTIKYCDVTSDMKYLQSQYHDLIADQESQWEAITELQNETCLLSDELAAMDSNIPDITSLENNINELYDNVNDCCQQLSSFDQRLEEYSYTIDDINLRVDNLNRLYEPLEFEDEEFIYMFSTNHQEDVIDEPEAGLTMFYHGVTGIPLIIQVYNDEGSDVLPFALLSTKIVGDSLFIAKFAHTVENVTYVLEVVIGETFKFNIKCSVEVATIHDNTSVDIDMISYTGLFTTGATLTENDIDPVLFDRLNIAIANNKPIYLNKWKTISETERYMQPLKFELYQVLYNNETNEPLYYNFANTQTIIDDENKIKIGAHTLKYDIINKTITGGVVITE